MRNRQLPLSFWSFHLTWPRNGKLVCKKYSHDQCPHSRSIVLKAGMTACVSAVVINAHSQSRIFMLTFCPALAIPSGSPRRLTMTTKIVKLRTLLAFLVPILYAIRVWRMGENSLNGHVIYKLIHAVRLLPYSWLSFVDTGGCTGCILQYFDYDPGPLEEGRRTSLSSSSDW